MVKTKKISISLILILTLIMMFMTGCGSNGTDLEEEPIEKEPIEKEKEQETQKEAKIGDTFMLGKDIEVTLNSTDRIERPEAVLVELDFTMTNKSEETLDWVGATNSFAYQDGVEIKGANLEGDEDQGNIWVGARPGGTVENIKEYFVTNGNDTEVEVILNPGQDWGNEDDNSVLIIVK